MTVELTSTGVVYVITSGMVGTEYPIPYPYHSERDIAVYTSIERGQKTKLKLNEDFVINNNTLITLVPLPVAAVIVIYRDTERTQYILWVDGQAIYPPNIMEADDKLTYIVQELWDAVSRTIQVSREDELNGITPDDLISQIYEWLKRAEDAAKRAEEAAKWAEGAVLSGQTANIRRTWVADADYAVGSEFILPVPYYIQRNMLMIYYNGIPCVPANAVLDGIAVYQYTEVGTDLDTMSDKIILNFAIKQGDLLDAWVLSSITQKMFDDISAMAPIVAENADRAEEAATRAETAADRAEAVSAPPVVQNEFIAITAHANYSVPEYTVGENRLEIYLAGLRVENGTILTEAQYAEQGIAGSRSTKIQFLDSYGPIHITALSRG